MTSSQRRKGSRSTTKKAKKGQSVTWSSILKDPKALAGFRKRYRFSVALALGNKDIDSSKTNFYDAALAVESVSATWVCAGSQASESDLGYFRGELKKGIQDNHIILILYDLAFDREQTKGAQSPIVGFVIAGVHEVPGLSAKYIQIDYLCATDDKARHPLPVGRILLTQLESLVAKLLPDVHFMSLFSFYCSETYYQRLGWTSVEPTAYDSKEAESWFSQAPVAKQLEEFQKDKKDGKIVPMRCTPTKNAQLTHKTKSGKAGVWYYKPISRALARLVNWNVKQG